MRPPSAEELVGLPPYFEDEERVLQIFLGKTADNALMMFRNRVATEPFAYLKPAGLLYYLPPALEYLKSAESERNFAFASGLLCSLSCQVWIKKITGSPLLLVHQIADYCDQHRENFRLVGEDPVEGYLKTIRGDGCRVGAMQA